MSKEFKIEAGKYVALRNEMRAYVVATNKPGIRNILGWIDDGTSYMWLGNGRIRPSNETAFDIISEWVEPERIPWEHLPRWCKWWVKQPCGTEWGTEKPPLHNDVSWLVNEAEYGRTRLPRSLNSNYTGDWRQSLRERLEGV